MYYIQTEHWAKLLNMLLHLILSLSHTHAHIYEVVTIIISVLQMKLRETK